LLKAIVLSLLLLVSGASAYAQTPLANLTSQVKRAVVIVNTYDQNGKLLTQGSGFFIAPDRILTNLRFTDSARDMRINTFTGGTFLVQSVIARYLDADLAVLQLTQACVDVSPLKVKKISLANGSAVDIDNSTQAQWVATSDPLAGWTFEHLPTHLQITASLTQTNESAPEVKLKGYVNGTATSVPR
jgi:S1-C subfamily serine protease